ncbi:unnamed protein product [Polarella glacialis]|uniref:Nucleotide-diphospho-sugar transferase domain-containing protein n=1 Tax=Polarella glacialis TaxID=89957 RepID=A0A813HEF6_POLGL|nr:unnamed protein product [Polarella glacialis]
MLPRLWRDASQQVHAQEGRCSAEIATREVLLLLLRLLGPTVEPRTDPLAQARTANLAELLGTIPLRILLCVGWPLFAMLSTVRLTSWRSHRLYPGGQVQASDIEKVVRLSWEVTREAKLEPWTDSKAWADTGLLGFQGRSEESRRALWARVASLGREAALCQRVASWLLEAPKETPPVVYMTMFWGSMGDDTWISKFLHRAMAVGITRFVFMTSELGLLADCEHVSTHWQALGDSYRRLLCVRSFQPFARPYDVNNYAKFVLLPLLLSLGVHYAWLDADIYLARDPTQSLLRQVAEGVDVLTTDHFDETCLNHGVIFVRVSDRSLLWSMRYIRWLHEYPFGHDQNGWDAFLAHSIHNEPMVPTEPNVTLSVLDTAFEFLTLTGWAGEEVDLQRVQLLHMTRTTPIGVREKRERLMGLFQATLPEAGARSVPLEVEQRALLEQLMPLRRPKVVDKNSCYEGIHPAVEPAVFDQTYWQLFE